MGENKIMMNYNELRDDITTGSLIGHLDDEGFGWVGVVIRAESLFNLYANSIDRRLQCRSGRIFGLYTPTAENRRDDGIHVEYLSHIIHSRTAIIRLLEDPLSCDEIDGFVRGAAINHRKNAATEYAAVINALLSPIGYKVKFDPDDGAHMVAAVWQNIGLMLPPPNGPRPETLRARHMLDPSWGPPCQVGISLSHPITIRYI
jgi:hypothetical protein